jgi:outer membrane murein-binding lipoprotein Lpp
MGRNTSKMNNLKSKILKLNNKIKKLNSDLSFANQQLRKLKKKSNASVLNSR